MNIEKIKDLIDASDMNTVQKASFKGFIDNAEQNKKRKNEDYQLIEKVANDKKISEIVLSTESVKIYAIYGTSDWAIKYPFRSIYLNDKGNWERVCTVSPSFDTAYLVYLGKKYIGSNTQFADFAIKMLDIKMEE